MRYLIRFFQLLVLVILVVVTVQNSEPVAFKLFWGQSWQAPLILFLLLFFVLGAAVGLVSTLSYYIKSRKELSVLKKALRNRPASKVTNDPSDALSGD